MATFILVNPEREVSSIAMLVNFRGKKYRKSIGESVRVKQWSSAKKRVKVTAGNTEAGLVNEKLDLWEEAARKAVAYFKEKLYIPDRKEFLAVLDSNRYEKSASRRIPVVEYFNKFIERYEPIRAHNRIKQYITTQNILERYSREEGKTIFFEDIDMNFYRSFLEWFYGKGYSSNYFGSVIRVLKVVYNEARDVDRLHSGTEVSGKNFSAPNEGAENIYLTTEELLKIHSLKIDEKLIREDNRSLSRPAIKLRTKAYRKAKDLFLIGAFTGLRFSDFSRIKDQNIKENITIKTQKTGVKVVIPIHWVVREIIDSGYDFNTALPEQKINRYIKEVARLAGIDGPVTLNRNIGGKPVEETFRKYELITTHTARRSFATNAYKAGVPTIAIMKITGHTKESTFLKYIKVSEQENAEMLKTHCFFRKSEDLQDQMQDHTFLQNDKLCLK